MVILWSTKCLDKKFNFSGLTSHMLFESEFNYTYGTGTIDGRFVVELVAKSFDNTSFTSRSRHYYIVSYKRKEIGFTEVLKNAVVKDQKDLLPLGLESIVEFFTEVFWLNEVYMEENFYILLSFSFFLLF